MADFKRATAYKLRIGDIFNSQKIFDGERFNFLDFNGKKVFRINIIANVIEKYVSSEKAYISLTIDDASGQIRIKIFGDDVSKFSEISQGDSVLIIGLIRNYNDELYINPEIIKKQDPRYLLVRKLEFEKMQLSIIDVKDRLALADKIINLVKTLEPEGISQEKLILDFEESPDLIKQEIIKSLEQGILYEPRPGMLRYLG